MHFDSADTNVQIECDRLIEARRDEPIEDLALARAKHCNARRGFRRLSANGWSAGLRHRRFNGFNESVGLVRLFDEPEYGRHLCSALAEASALKDPRLVPGLKKVAAYHVEGKDYDCRPKWMAIAALARQESPNAVPLLVSLVDHGNQNTRFWARAALARMAKTDFKADKQAWNKWWVGQGHDAIDPALLKPYTGPVAEK